jgi:hypothetical protein
MTSIKTVAILALAAGFTAMLSACAGAPESRPDFAAKNRPLEERCLRAQLNSQKPPVQPNRTPAEIQRDAQLANSRGELDKACDWL